jgi:hypothetical protein
LPHLLSFRFIPAYTHRRLQTLSGHFVLSTVYSFYTVLQLYSAVRKTPCRCPRFLHPQSTGFVEHL